MTDNSDKRYRDGWPRLPGTSDTDPERWHPLLTYFDFEHLPNHLQEVSRDYHFVAAMLVARVPCNSESVMGLRKLLEAKDCAVRAALI